MTVAHLAEALPGTKLSAPMPGDGPRTDDDLTTQVHRRLIGIIGLLLPITVYVIAALLPNRGVDRWELLGSISGYYYTAAVSVFVGLLIALALFLFAYRGYDNKLQWADRTVAIIAGIAALGVAAFPTNPTAGALAPLWWGKAAAWVHYISAAVLFLMFATYCLALFPRGDPNRPPSPDKSWQNKVYVACGVAIVLSIVWAAIAGRSQQPIFVPEAVALVAFATSWLIKGSAHKLGRPH